MVPDVIVGRRRPPRDLPGMPDRPRLLRRGHARGATVRDARRTVGTAAATHPGGEDDLRTRVGTVRAAPPPAAPTCRCGSRVCDGRRLEVGTTDHPGRSATARHDTVPGSRPRRQIDVGRPCRGDGPGLPGNAPVLPAGRRTVRLPRPHDGHVGCQTPRRKEGSMRTSTEVCREVGISYRQLNHWTTRGWVRSTTGEPSPGPGNPRGWSAVDVDAVRLFAVLSETALSHEEAADAVEAWRRAGHPPSGWVGKIDHRLGCHATIPHDAQTVAAVRLSSFGPAKSFRWRTNGSSPERHDDDMGVER